MNKVFYIIGIAASIAFFILSGYYMTEVDSARTIELLQSFDSYSSGYSSYSVSTVADDLTMEIGTISLFFFLLFIVIDVLGLAKIKTTTSRVLSIIGLCVTAIFVVWDFGVLSSPGAMSFDEVGLGWWLYCLTMLTFSIVGLVQSFRGAQPGKADLLDS